MGSVDEVLERVRGVERRGGARIGRDWVFEQAWRRGSPRVGVAV